MEPTKWLQQSKAISTMLSSKRWESSFLLLPGKGFEGRVEGDTNVEGLGGIYVEGECMEEMGHPEALGETKMRKFQVCWFNQVAFFPRWMNKD